MTLPLLLSAIDTADLRALAAVQARVSARLAELCAAERQAPGPTLTVAEAARILGVSRGFMYKRPEVFGILRRGRRCVVPAGAVERWRTRMVR